MALYECTFITRPDLPQPEVNKYVDKFSALVVEGGGKVLKTEHWGLRNLAYRIKKNKKGYYVHMGLEADQSIMLELDRNLKIAEDIIRHLSVRVEEVSDEPSAIMRQASLNEAFLEEEPQAQVEA